MSRNTGLAPSDVRAVGTGVDGTGAGRPRLLDLFCGGGGAAMGYHRAGFDVVGVDVKPQPNYPFTFIQADAIDVLLALASEHRVEPLWPTAITYTAAIHASPPCPHYSLVSGFQGVADQHPDLIGPVRELLEQVGLPYVIENVPGAPLRRDLVLCGEMFGLRVHRHRVFETSGFFAMQPPHSRHNLRGGKTNCETGPGIARWVTGNYADHEDAAGAMGIDWMKRGKELANAIPAGVHRAHRRLLAACRPAPGGRMNPSARHPRPRRERLSRRSRPLSRVLPGHAIDLYEPPVRRRLRSVGNGNEFTRSTRMSDDKSGIVRFLMVGGEVVRGMGDLATLAIAVTTAHRAGGLVSVQDPGDAREKFVIAAMVVCVEEEPDEEARA